MTGAEITAKATPSASIGCQIKVGNVNVTGYDELSVKSSHEPKNYKVGVEALNLKVGSLCSSKTGIGCPGKLQVLNFSFPGFSPVDWGHINFGTGGNGNGNSDGSEIKGNVDGQDENAEKGRGNEGIEVGGGVSSGTGICGGSTGGEGSESEETGENGGCEDGSEGRRELKESGDSRESAGENEGGGRVGGESREEEFRGAVNTKHLPTEEEEKPIHLKMLDAIKEQHRQPRERSESTSSSSHLADLEEPTYGELLSARVSEDYGAMFHELKKEKQSSQERKTENKIPASRDDAIRDVRKQIQSTNEQLADIRSRKSREFSSSKSHTSDIKPENDAKHEGIDESKDKPFGANKNIHTLGCFHNKSSKTLKSLGGQKVGFQD